jgi:hypothetical protein
MATALGTTKEIQDKVFAGIETGQKAVVDVVRSWAETVELTFSRLPELAFADPAKPSELMEATFGFSERVFNSNREFASKLFEAWVPFGRATTAGTESAASAASAASKLPPKP